MGESCRRVVVVFVLVLGASSASACTSSDGGDDPAELERIDQPAQVDPDFRPLDPPVGTSQDGGNTDTRGTGG